MWGRFLFSEVLDTKDCEVILNGSWGAGIGVIAGIWASRFAPGATERPLLTTLVAAFGTLVAFAIWFMTYMECKEWLAPWDNRDDRKRKPNTTPWRMGTCLFALAGAIFLFYFGPAAAIASIRSGYFRNSLSAISSLKVAHGDAIAFWIFLAIAMVSMFMQKAFAILDPSVIEKNFSYHRMAKYGFVFVIAIIALSAQALSLPGIAFVFMPSLLVWYASTSGSLEQLTVNKPHLREALPQFLWICIGHWMVWFILFEVILYGVLVYLPTPLAV